MERNPTQSGNAPAAPAPSGDDVGAVLERFRTSLGEEARRGFAGAAAERLFAEGSSAGDWTVLGFLARGGSSEVYCARHRTLGTPAVLKVLHRTEPRHFERFRRETRFLMERPGPSFPAFYGSGETGGRPWIAIEPLDEFPPPSADADVARYLLDVADGLSALHARGRVHRDVKPANILRRADGHAVLVDFGLLKEIAPGDGEGDDAPAPGDPGLSVVDGRAVGVGTPGYAAPEQFAGGPATPALDVHALGMLANRCFGGRPPRAWRRIVLRAVAPPALRYPTVAAFARAVRRRHLPLRCLQAAFAVATLALLPLLPHPFPGTGVHPVAPPSESAPRSVTAIDSPAQLALAAYRRRRDSDRKGLLSDIDLALKPLDAANSVTAEASRTRLVAAWILATLPRPHGNLRRAKALHQRARADGADGLIADLLDAVFAREDGHPPAAVGILRTARERHLRPLPDMPDELVRPLGDAARSAWLFARGAVNLDSEEVRILSLLGYGGIDDHIARYLGGGHLVMR